MTTSATLATIADTTGPVTLDRIELYRVSIPLTQPFRISSGEIARKDAVLVRIGTDDLFGWGESSAMTGSFYSDETPDGCWADLTERIARCLAGRKFSSIAALDTCLRELRPDRFAIAGVETAAWELAARSRGCSVRELLGIPHRPIPSGLAVGLYDSAEDLLAALDWLRPEQYHRLKLKINRGHDVEVVRAAPRRYPKIPLFVYANADYTLAEAAVFSKLDNFQLTMLEQPPGKTDVEGSAELQQQVSTPIRLDESIDSAQNAAKATAASACRIVNLKLQRVGGMIESLRIIDICSRTGTPMCMGTMPELGIGSAQALAVAGHSAFVLPTDIEPSSRSYTDDVVSPCIELNADGCIDIPSGAGWGYQVDHSKLPEWCIDRMAL